MKNIKNKFYSKLKLGKDIRKVMRFFNEIKPIMVKELKSK